MGERVYGIDHPDGVRATEQKPQSWWRVIFKNILAFSLAGGIWLALQTGYVSPDRPTRSQWERIERAKGQASGQLVYQANFQRDILSSDIGAPPNWGRYNGATQEHVKFGSGGVTVAYSGIAWIGARLSFPDYEPGSIYRLTVQATAHTEPGAILVRNRQLDLVRTTVPVGSGTARTHFVAPRGRLDQVIIAFIADNPSQPKGALHIASVSIERMNERAAGRTE